MSLTSHVTQTRETRDKLKPLVTYIHTLMCTISCHFLNLQPAHHAVSVTRDTLLKSESPCRMNWLLGCVFTAVRWRSVSVWSWLRTLFLFFLGCKKHQVESQVVRSMGFISTEWLRLIKFDEPKGKSPLLHSNPANKRDWRERGVEWLTMAFTCKPYQRRKSLPVIL